MSCLLISVRFHDGRYHGRSDWPPSPARLFQALIAGAAQGEILAGKDRAALGWFETLEAPIIMVPSKWSGQAFENFVPNNDLDAVGGDLRRIGKIRSRKVMRPVLLNAEIPLLYGWTFEATPEALINARRILAITDQLYQLGRGVDMAWAWGEILTTDEAQSRIDEYQGALHQPSNARDGAELPVPVRGSLESLIVCHEKARTRFETLYERKPTQKAPNQKVATGQIFSQPPKPRFRKVAYNSPSRSVLFELIGSHSPWRLDQITALTETVRDAAADRLKDRLPAKAETIHNAIIGRRHGREADKTARIRITPLPSIGHRHADHAIRRILVEIPPNCPIRADDVEWAFAGLPFLISDQGEVLCELTKAVELGMLRHFGVGNTPSRLWRSVTPVALPYSVARRRVDPKGLPTNAKGGLERAEEDARAAFTVVQALRHSGVSACPSAVRMQREPFDSNGSRTEAFAPGTRFGPQRLWHVEVAFDTPQPGPLIIGDGRYLGLGLLAPVRRAEGVLAFAIENEFGATLEPLVVARALRRAVLARAQAEIGQAKALPLFITGHERDGAPSRGGSHRHIAFVHDPGRRRLLLIAPHVFEHRSPARSEAKDWDVLERAMIGFQALRVGGHVLRVTPTGVDFDGDPLFAPAREWESMTPYRVVRHRKLADAAAAVSADIVQECREARLPSVTAQTREARGITGSGLTGRARLAFEVAVPGPILIGRDRHFGGGLFLGVREIPQG